jgi:opine dehydrogenase
VFPARLHERAFAVLRRAFPSVEPVEDALSAALMNAGPIIHPPLILMNAGPLEHFERWDIHKEGTQPAIRRVTDALDAERIAVRTALGYRAPHFPLADHYRADGDEWMYGRRVHQKLTDSSDWREHIVLTEHRYMREDIEHGLAFLVSVGEWAGVPCPVALGLLALASAVVGRDLRATGRTLETLGLASRSRAAMTALLAG